MKITLTRQVTDGNSVLAPGAHDVPEALAKLYLERGWGYVTGAGAGATAAPATTSAEPLRPTKGRRKA